MKDNLLEKYHNAFNGFKDELNLPMTEELEKSYKKILEILAKECECLILLDYEKKE